MNQIISKFPLVSVCLPVYNGAKYIRGAIESIINTTYPNLEIIVSDDNSNDDTVNIIKSSNLPQLKLFTHQRYGLVQNWNYCLSKANGKYIKFLFQDDLLEPDCIELMVKVAESNSTIGLVFSPRYLIYEYYDQLHHFPKILHTGWSKLSSIQTGLSLLQDSNLFKHPHNKIGEPTCTLIRSSVFNQVGTFDPCFRQYVDLEMWYRIMTNYHIAFINKPLASFRIHRDQQTNINSETQGIELEIYQVWKKMLTDSSDYNLLNFTHHKLKHLLRKQILIDIVKYLIKFRINEAISLLNWSRQENLSFFTLI